MEAHGVPVATSSSAWGCHPVIPLQLRGMVSSQSDTHGACLNAGPSRQALLNSRKTVTQAAVQFRDKGMQEAARLSANSQAGLPPMGTAFAAPPSPMPCCALLRL